MNQSQTSFHRYFDIFTFLLPSFLGLFFFLCPISYDDKLTIPIAIFIESLKGKIVPLVVCCLILITTLISLFACFLKPKIITKYKFLSDIFLITKFSMLLRFIGSAFVVMYFFPNYFSPLYFKLIEPIVQLCNTLLCTFLIAGLLLPLLLEFGLVNFIGVKSQKLMQRVFNLPGFSAVGCLTSWFGDGSLGVIITDNQYRNNQYTQREAAVVATNFSAVSISFMLIVLAAFDLGFLFLEFYATVCITGIAAAIIVPKLPPLSNKKDIYFNGLTKSAHIKTLDVSFNHALSSAIAKIRSINSVKNIFIDSIKNSLATILSLLPVVMAVGTLAYFIAENTNFFVILGTPFFYIFDFLGLPEAQAASSAVLIGFADMLLPSVLAQSIQSDMVRFIIACLSVTQLVYLSEIGALILSSSIPLSILELFCIFIVRTIVCFPIIYLFSLFFF